MNMVARLLKIQQVYFSLSSSCYMTFGHVPLRRLRKTYKIRFSFSSSWYNKSVIAGASYAVIAQLVERRFRKA